VGKAHLLGFGSFEGVKYAKGQLYDYLKAHDGVAFANADDETLQEMLWERDLAMIPYGLEGVTVLPASADEPFLRMQLPGGAVLETHLVGAYNAYNILAALKIGWFFQVPEADAMAAIASYTPSNNRSQLLKTEKNTVIVDAYNANPSSMAVALDNLALMPGRKVALLGDMRDLGADAEAEHKRVVERLEGLEAYLVGEEFAKAAAGTSHKTFATSEDLAKYLKENPLEGCTVLLKGSHSIQMEKVIDSL
jgi:UDP-N-acetylmuramoyl-tripeptide--D-alanyl-D-alanine ligase